ncbi:MAG: hypothetical protein WCA77_06005 [Thermoplasmata archaeon]
MAAPRFATKRLAASILVLVSGILAGVSAFTPWWIASLSGSTTGSTDFYPGASFSIVNSKGVVTWFTYASRPDVSSLSGIYEGVLAMTLVVLILALVVAAIGVLAATWHIRNPARHRLIMLLIVVLFVISLIAIILVPVAQPSSTTGCAGSGQTVCNSFWGSASGGGLSTMWGASAGWYLAIASAVVLVAALFVWRSSSSEPWPVGPASVHAAPTMVTCARCGQPRPWGQTPCPTCGGP